MGRTAEVLLWAWIILDSGGFSVSVPEITDEEFVAECVREHNRARSSVKPSASNMLYMTWDEGLAVTARAWARHCLFEHNTHLEEPHRMHPTFSSVGENIWTGYPSFNATSAIKSWVDEKLKYNYNSHYCTGVCGHYTQVVWARSYKVGCAAQRCPDGVKATGFGAREAFIFVCNYAPAGNIRGVKPYQSQGAACSGCNLEETCLEKLCRNKARDSQERYNWTPDWDPALTASDNNNNNNYMPILIARPIGLIATFITAYVVRYFYPDVFCYE